MSEADRTKWDERYRGGAYADRGQPSEVLRAWIHRLPRGRALDVACGAGRNALYLAAQGYQVDAVDISGEALARARESARAAGLEVNWIEHDLDAPPPLAPGYALVLAVRFMNLERVRQLADWLDPGGCLVTEQHLLTDAEVIGPANPAYRVRPGELRGLARGLELLHYEEGLFDDPDGRRAALARLVARRAGPD